MTVRELKNATITHVSYVDKGANQKKFFMTKSEESTEPTFEKQVKLLTKDEDEQMLVYGVVYEPDVVDAHGDMMNAQEIEKSAHEFMKEFRNIDTQHNFESGAGEVVESYVAPTDIEVGDEVIQKGSWVLVTKATEEVWEQIKKGEITGYSMAGTAEVEEVEKEQDSQMRKFFQTMKEFFTGEDVQKGELTDAYNDSKKRRNLFDALWLFEDFVISEIFADSPDPEKLREYAQEIGEIFSTIANEPDIVKSLQKEHEEREEVQLTKEEMKELLKEEMAPISDRVEALEKKEEEETEEEVEKSEEEEAEEVQKEQEQKDEEKAELVKSFKAVLKEELEPLSERLETVEKARGISKSADTDDAEEVEKEEGSVWRGLL